MKIGYARVSTAHQVLDGQMEKLEAVGCERIYHDVVSGSASARPGLDEMDAQLRHGDVVVVWRLDRLGRNTQHLIELVNDWQERGVGLSTLDGMIDTTSPSGRFVFTEEH